jgi:hypothetical protein
LRELRRVPPAFQHNPGDGSAALLLLQPLLAPAPTNGVGVVRTKDGDELLNAVIDG